MWGKMQGRIQGNAMNQNKRRQRRALAMGAGLMLAGLAATLPLATRQVMASDPPTKDPLGYQDTPMLPGGKWHVHDGFRPQPTVVTPGGPSLPDAPGKAPSDAIVLFDGTSASLQANWKMEGSNDAPAWTMAPGGAMIPAKGSLESKQEFGDCQLHVEWRTPTPAQGNGQGRGNSGVFLMGQYEMQVLDSFGNPTYPDGQASAVYGQYPPLVNASLPPGTWQTYDIIWTAPRFNPDHSVVSPGYVTILHNGVLTQNHQALLGKTDHRTLGSYHFFGDKGPLQLQFHGNPVAYRNIWIRPLPPTGNGS